MRPPSLLVLAALVVLTSCSRQHGDAADRNQQPPAFNKESESPTANGVLSQPSQPPKSDKVVVESVLRDGGQPNDAELETTIAVVDFSDQGPSVQLAPLRTALAEMLTGDLSQYENLQAVERVRVSQFLSETDFGGSGRFEASTVQKAGQTLAAEYLLTGSFSGKGETLTVEATLLKVSEKEPRARWKLLAPASQLIGLEERLAEAVLQALGMVNPSRRPPPKPREGPSPSVAILGLRNLGTSSRLDAMQNGFADILQANLAALEDIRLVERGSLHEVLKEQELSLAELADPATAVKLGKLVGAERLIYGSFLEMGDDLRIDLRVVDTETAAVLRAASSSGNTDGFADQLETLALRVASALAIRPPANATRLVQAASPAHKLEAAIHYANAQEAYRQGEFANSAENHQRALLVEPSSHHSGLGRIKARFAQRNYHLAVAAGEQALRNRFSGEQRNIKGGIYSWLLQSYWMAQMYREHGQLCRRIMVEYQGTDFGKLKKHLAFSLLHQKRRDEGIAMFEEVIRDPEVQRDPHAYGEALRDFHSYLIREKSYILPTREYQTRKSDPEYARKISKQTKQSAKRAIEVLDLILDEAKGKRTREWRDYARPLAHWVNVQYVSERGYLKVILTPEQSLDYLEKVLDVFGWDPQAAYYLHNELTIFYREYKQWDQALVSYNFIRAHARHARRDGLPCSWDIRVIGPTSRLDVQIEAHYQIAEIHRTALNEPKKATREYQELIREFGFKHHRGPETFEALHELGADVELPAKSVLIWGGASEARDAWKSILAPLGYEVHGVGAYDVSPAELSRYSLVVLVRTGNVPYLPSHGLALRSFVATGGALLCVVSPGWERAAPGVHNALLEFFDVRASEQVESRARSTHIHSHPITEGIESATAKCAVHLSAAATSRVIQCGEKTVLVAMPYRYGRVVVASFGQWFLPLKQFRRAGIVRWQNHWTYEFPFDEIPLAEGRDLELPLLQNVLSWLLQPSENGMLTEQQRQLFQDAQLVNLKKQYRLLPYESLAPAMDRLVAGATAGTCKEEALWAAGEAFQYLMYFGSAEAYERVVHSVPRGMDVPAPILTHYEQLIDQFPKSPMRPYAEWRLADSQRSPSGARLYASRGGAMATEGRKAGIALYRKVDASEGSYLWAWRELRVGVLLFQMRDYSSALKHFRVLAEQLQSGPEKTFALHNAAACYTFLEQKEEATRYFRRVVEAPNLYTLRHGREAMAPLRRNGRFGIGSSQKHAEEWLSSTDTQ